MAVGFGFVPWGVGPWGGAGGVGGPPAVFEVEMPGVYLDAGVEDTTNPAIPVAINRTPEPGEVQVAIDTVIRIELAATSSTVSLAATKVYIEGVLAFDGGVFQPGFGGPSSASSNPQSDVLRIAIDQDANFASLQVVTVRVVSALAATPGTLLDASYDFTCEDLIAPGIQLVEAQDLQRLRVSFTEEVSDTALNVGNYALAYTSVPAVTAVVVSATRVTGQQVDLLTDIALTPGAFYRLTAVGVYDLFSNVVVAPGDTAFFTGFMPEKPATRRFDLWKKLPEINRREDTTGDLSKFIACLQEPTDLLLYDIDNFVEILDPDFCEEQYLDAMLADLGNPFAFDLAVEDKRRLVQVLAEMYRLKGTEVGLKNVVLFFLGIEVSVVLFVDTLTMTLGESVLGGLLDSDWVLGQSNSFLLYAFQVSVATALSDTVRSQVRAIVEYMKPAHTHFVGLIEPVVPIVADHLELGLSELGGNQWMLH